jgi:REP element-mobilizing transposase RayT
VTVCSHDRWCIFGEVASDVVRLSDLGLSAELLWRAIPDHFPWVELDAWIVMPNHIHGILNLADRLRRGVQLNAPTKPRRQDLLDRARRRSSQMGSISPRRGSLSIVVRTYKAAIARVARQKGMKEPVWQRGFFEHIIRTEQDLQRLRSYILDNPARWSLDEENPFRTR